MAYVPPHKRHLLDKNRPAPTAEPFVPLFKKKLTLNNIDRSRKIVYADDAINRWFALGLAENGHFPSFIRLEPVSSESGGNKALVLVNSSANEENSVQEYNFSRTPWVFIAENVHKDLVSAFETLRKEMCCHGLEKVKPALVARFGKIHFHGNGSVGLDNLQKNQIDEATLRQLKTSIYTNIPSSYMENVVNQVVPEIGVEFEEEKEVYHVKLFDNMRPNSTISCKCRVQADKRLLVYKVELNQVRQMVLAISCLDKNLDLRLMLSYKQILTALTDEEMNSIKDLVGSAILDSEVKGGLRWPFGKTSSGNRFSVVGASHTISKTYSNPSIRLKVRHADRYAFGTGAGEATREIYMKLKGILSELQEQGEESDLVPKMLEQNFKLIWDKFLCSGPF